MRLPRQCPRARKRKRSRGGCPRGVATRWLARRDIMPGMALVKKVTGQRESWWYEADLIIADVVHLRGGLVRLDYEKAVSGDQYPGDQTVLVTW